MQKCRQQRLVGIAISFAVLFWLTGGAGSDGNDHCTFSPSRSACCAANGAFLPDLDSPSVDDSQLVCACQPDGALRRIGASQSVGASQPHGAAQPHGAFQLDDRFIANAQSGERFDQFENEIRPILVKRCLACHGPTNHEAGLRLDSMEAAMLGGDSGPVIVPGEPDQSRLIDAVQRRYGLEMPPDDPLSAEQIAQLERWIQDGAQWPEDVVLSPVGNDLRGGPITEDERLHWSLQPIIDPSPPVTDQGEIHNPIDRFVVARLNERNLVPVNQADKRTLIRRATFDLTGLPPSQAEINAFINDDSPLAFERVVDRLLASPAYGERWGRHWLDVVRYADTAGETADFPTPQSYRYRNWVIHALNDDLAYDDFIRHQIAGDLIAKRDPAVTAERYEQLVTATGFIAISRRFGFDVDGFHYLTIQDTIDTIGQSVLGLTLGCARCHDHKYDPINVDDYYGWYGILDSTRYSNPGCEANSQPADMIPAVPPSLAEQLDIEYRNRIASIDQRLAANEEAIRQLESSLTIDQLGSFELETIDQSPGAPWTCNEGGRITEAAQSPFVNVFEAGERGLEFPSDDQNGHFGFPLQSLPNDEPTDRIWLSIDFRNLDESFHGDGEYRFYLGHGPGTSAAVELSAGERSLSIKNGSQYEQLAELEPGRWYNLQLDVDLANREVAGVLSSAVGSIRFGAVRFTEGWDGILDKFLVDDYGVRFGKSPARQFDNLYIGLGPLPAFAKDEDETVDGSQQHAADASLSFPRESSESSEIQVSNVRLELIDLIRVRSDLELERIRWMEFQPYEQIYGAVDRDVGSDATIHIRGSSTDLGPVVSRRNLEILGGQLIVDAESSGRLDMAQWLTDRNNPLTARVMANRIWHHHFGRGLVVTVNDFGVRGSQPSHPMLLDWLAARFIESGWSIKSMHRLIMLSAVYQRSSDYNASAVQTDPDARWLWRFNRRRLSAEEIRDAMLLVAGNLDREMGDTHPFPAIDSWGFTQHEPFHAEYPSNKRSVFLMQQRLHRHRFLGLFDGADPNVSMGTRSTTTVPTQWLFLINDPFVHAQSESFARQMIDRSTDPVVRIQFGYERALGRPASQEEVHQAIEFHRVYEQAILDAAPEADELDAHDRTLQVWAAFARTLLARNEFLYVD